MKNWKTGQIIGNFLAKFDKNEGENQNYNSFLKWLQSILDTLYKYRVRF